MIRGIKPGAINPWAVQPEMIGLVIPWGILMGNLADSPVIGSMANHRAIAQHKRLSA
jgi:hypothetical protein